MQTEYEALPGVDAVVAALLRDDKIERIELGRQMVMSGHVSQDLELWVAKEQDQDHWNVAARSGSKVQQLAVYGTASLDSKEALRGAIATVLGTDASPAGAALLDERDTRAGAVPDSAGQV